MVVTFLPAALESGITQERTGSPSRCTVKAPHCARPQPKWGLFMPRSLRSAYSSGISGSAFTETRLPSTMNLKLAMFPPQEIAPDDQNEIMRLAARFGQAGNGWIPVRAGLSGSLPCAQDGMYAAHAIGQRRGARLQDLRRLDLVKLVFLHR